MWSVSLYVCACACLLHVTHAQDTYLDTARASCMRSGGLMDCARYKAANLVHRIASSRRSFDMGPLRLVSVPSGNVSAEDSPLSRAAADSPRDPELLKMFKFGIRQVERFLQSHGVSLPLSALGGGGGGAAHLVYDDGTDTNTITAGLPMSDDQSRSRNIHLVVPLMIMVKLMSINALLIPTLLGVAAIKKFIILTIMVLPSFLQKLKACKIVPHLVHYQPHHTHSHEFHDDYYPHHGHGHGHEIHRRVGQYRSFTR